MPSTRLRKQRVFGRTPQKPVIETYVEPKPEPTLTKTVVFKWVQNRDVIDARPDYSWGLGDILRGMISTYQYCKKHRHEFVIDISQHPIASLLTPSSFYCKNLPYAKVKRLGHDGGHFNTLQVGFTGDKQLLFTNVWPLTPLLQDEKELVKSIMIPKTVISVPTPKTYSVVHIRTGDDAMNGKQLQLEKYLDLITKYAKPNDYIITDNTDLKKRINHNQLPYRILNADQPVVHSGYAADGLSYTLDDFHLVCGASKVYTYSVYTWVSGFVNWACKCYDVELVNISDLSETSVL